MLRTAFWIFVLFLALSFFGISVEAIVSSPTGQANLAYLAYLALTGWNWLSLQLHAIVEALIAAWPLT